ncbi:hypothetical protein OEV98_12480 [Caldibacillus lycopersici]|uniref:DUF6602 domain-containing protein n=1 Tax=Perspicuibacillus lycopersici TaxID=1325689 RepID=A0AAE3LTQ5_9BACI|nr:DUF6602 domain-containing protein [Perspicuibacillus lycopersici]MCU9614353.1 hypothetical protein [Perspicuibacillus lycopersici]
MTHKLTLSPSLYHQFEKLVLEINLIRQLTTHPGEKGHEFEGILKNFLKDVVPKRYKLSTGFIVNESGISGQTDIMIYNQNEIPALYSGYELEIIPVHSLAASIEVKMTLTPAMVTKCQTDAYKIKRLFRGSVKAQIDGMNEDEREKYPEPLCVLFAYNTDSSTIKSFIDKLNEPDEKGIDLILLMDKGYISWDPINKIYKYSDGSGYKYLGASSFNLNITKSHRFFLEFYMEFINHLYNYNSVIPNITSWAQLDIVYFDE